MVAGNEFVPLFYFCKKSKIILQAWPYTNSSQNINLQMLHFELILSAWTQLHENTRQV